MSGTKERLQITNPGGVPFHVEYESPFVTFYDARTNRLVSSFTLSTLQSKILLKSDVQFPTWMPNALPDWWVSYQNVKDVLDWVDAQCDPSEIPVGMKMGDGTIAQVGQQVVFKWFGRYKEGTITEILNPNDLGTPPAYLPIRNWKVSETEYILWHRALVKVYTYGMRYPIYYGVAIAPLSGSNMRIVKNV